jgi:hypothetical protein
MAAEATDAVKRWTIALTGLGLFMTALDNMRRARPSRR